MSTPIDLITNARARVALPSAAASPSADDSAINTLITACSRAIQRYCKRWFVQQAFDELYSGNADRRLILRNHPLVDVQSVRYRPVTVFKVTNTLANTPQARVKISYNSGSPALILSRVTSGLPSTDATLVLASYPSLASLVAQINTYSSNGWSAVLLSGTGLTAQDYGSWPSADLWCPNGPAASTYDPYYNPAGQGNLQCVSGSYAEIKLHTYELQGYQYDARQGWLLRAIPYTDPELLHPEDLIFPLGINNFRVQYTAGFATIPDDVQEACAQLVAYHFRLGPRESPDTVIPPIIAQYLAAYRDHKITIGGG